MHILIQLKAFGRCLPTTKCFLLIQFRWTGKFREKALLKSVCWKIRDNMLFRKFFYQNTWRHFPEERTSVSPPIKCEYKNNIGLLRSLGENGYKLNPVTKASVLSKYYFKIHFETFHSFTRWQRCIKLGSTAARLLWLWVRIPSSIWTSASCECCVFCQVCVSASGWSLIQRSVVWLCTWILNNQEPLVEWGLLPSCKKIISHHLHYKH